MYRRVLLGIIGLALVVGMGAPLARARKPSVSHKLRKKLTLKFSTQKPTFSSQRTGELMDRGRLLYLGRGIWHEQAHFYFLRLKDMKRFRVRAPVQQYLMANRRRFPRAGTGKRLPAYRLLRLLFYDSKHGVAGILIDDKVYRAGGRLIYLHWDLGKKRITRSIVLATNTPQYRWMSVKPVGYSPKRRALYLQVMKNRRQSRNHSRVVEASVVSVSKGRLKTITTFRSRRFSRGPFHDSARERAFLVEYAERGTPAYGYLVNLVTGKRKRMRIPVVTYGVAFSSDGKRIFTYSGQTGYLWAINARTGRRLKKKRLGSLGHAAGMIFGDTLLVARNKGLHFINAKSLKQWKVLPTKTWHRGFMHVQGTLVTRGRVFLRTSDTLRVIDFKKR